MRQRNRVNRDEGRKKDNKQTQMIKKKRNETRKQHMEEGSEDESKGRMAGNGKRQED